MKWCVCIVVMIMLMGCMHQSDSGYEAESFESDASSVELPEEDESAQPEPEQPVQDTKLYEDLNENMAIRMAAPLDAVTTEDLFSQYTDQMLNPGDTFTWEDDGKRISVRLDSFETGDQTLREEFGYLSEEDMEFAGYTCNADELFVYYTLTFSSEEDTEIWATFARLCNIVEYQDHYYYNPLHPMEGLWFYPCELYDSRGPWISLQAGVPQTVICAEKIRQEDLNGPIYLVLNPMGTYLFGSDAPDPEDLWEATRAAIGVVGVQ